MSASTDTDGEKSSAPLNPQETQNPPHNGDKPASPMPNSTDTSAPVTLAATDTASNSVQAQPANKSSGIDLVSPTTKTEDRLRSSDPSNNTSSNAFKQAVASSPTSGASAVTATSSNASTTSKPNSVPTKARLSPAAAATLPADLKALLLAHNALDIIAPSASKSSSTNSASSSSKTAPSSAATVTSSKSAPLSKTNPPASSPSPSSTSEKATNAPKASGSKTQIDRAPALKEWFRSLDVEGRRKAVSIMDEELGELLLLMSLKVKKEGPGVFYQVGETADLDPFATQDPPRSRSNSLSHLPPHSTPSFTPTRSGRSASRGAGSSSSSSSRSKSQTREPILRNRLTTTFSLSSSSSASSSNSLSGKGSTSLRSSLDTMAPSSSTAKKSSRASTSIADDILRSTLQQYGKDAALSSSCTPVPSSSQPTKAKITATNVKGVESSTSAVNVRIRKSPFPIRYFDDFFASDLIALNPYTPAEENFLFRRHCSLINMDSFTSKTIQADQELMDAVRLGDAKQYLDTLTLSRELLSKPGKFFRLMRIASRGEFLKRPCPISWQGKTGTWAVGNPRWFEEMGVYTFSTYVAAQFESRLWFAYYNYANIDPRRESGHFGSGANKATNKVGFGQNRHQDTLVSKSHLVEYWTRLSHSQKTDLIRSMGNMIEARVKLDLSDLSYPQLLNFMVKLTSVSHNVSTPDNPLLQPNNEREFIDFIFLSPLRRAGTGMDLVLRRLGVFIETAYVDQQRADLILGEKMEKEKAKNKRSGKKSRVSHLVASPSEPTNLATNPVVPPTKQQSNPQAAPTQQQTEVAPSAAAVTTAPSQPKTEEPPATASRTSAAIAPPKVEPTSAMTNQALATAGFMVVAGRRKGPFTRSKDDSAAPNQKKPQQVDQGKASRRAKDDTHSGTWTGPKRASAANVQTAPVATVKAPNSPKSKRDSPVRVSPAVLLAATALNAVPSLTSKLLSEAMGGLPDAPLSPSSTGTASNSSTVSNHTSTTASTSTPISTTPSQAPQTIPASNPLKTSSESLPAPAAAPEQRKNEVSQRSRPTSSPPAPQGRSIVPSPQHNSKNDNGKNESTPTSEHGTPPQANATKVSKHQALRSSDSASSSSSSSSNASSSTASCSSFPTPQSLHMETMSDRPLRSSSHNSDNLLDRPHPTQKTKTMPSLYRSAPSTDRSTPKPASSSASSATTSPSPMQHQMRQSTPPGRLQGIEAWMPQYIPQWTGTMAPIEFGPATANVNSPSLLSHSSGSVNTHSHGDYNTGGASGRSRSATDDQNGHESHRGANGGTNGGSASSASHEGARSTDRSSNWKHKKNNRGNGHNQNTAGTGADVAGVHVPPTLLAMPIDPHNPLAYAGVSAPGFVSVPIPFGVPQAALVTGTSVSPTATHLLLAARPSPAIHEPVRFEFPSRSTQGCKLLTTDILEFVARVDTATAPRSKTVSRTLVSVQRVVDACFPGQGLCAEIYGSFSTNLGIPASDLDLVITGHPKLGKDIEPPTSPRGVALIPLTALYAALTHENWVLPEKMQLIDTASVPVIKLVCVDSDLPVDITMEDRMRPHTGLTTRSLTRSYCEKYQDLRPLALVLKQMLHDCNLHNIYTGGISSYFLVLLIVSYLQVYGHTASNLGGHLLNMLDLYGNKFNFATTQISVIEPGNHTVSPNAAFHPPPALEGMLPPPSTPPLNIVDPLNPSQTVGQSVFGMWQVQIAFKNAFQVLHAHYLDDSSHSRPSTPRKGVEHLLASVLVPPSV